MIVRLRFGEGRPVSKQRGKNRHLALAGNAILVPTALMAYVLGFWSLAADLSITKPFALHGTLSHWQLWMVVGAAVHIAARRLMRYGSGVPAGNPEHPPTSPAARSRNDAQRISKPTNAFRNQT